MNRLSLFGYRLSKLTRDGFWGRKAGVFLSSWLNPIGIGDMADGFYLGALWVSESRTKLAWALPSGSNVCALHELVHKENPTGIAAKTKSQTGGKGFLGFLWISATKVSVRLVWFVVYNKLKLQKNTLFQGVFSAIFTLFQGENASFFTLFEGVNCQVVDNLQESFFCLHCLRKKERKERNESSPAPPS